MCVVALVCYIIHDPGLSIAGIHTLADRWQCSMQVLVAQKNPEDRIIRLSGAMSGVFASVEEAEPLKRIKAHMKTITLLVQRVTECGYFISD